MKTKLTSVTYLGFTAMDRRFSTLMLPWLIKEIRSTGICDKLSISVEDGCLKAYNANFEPVIVHRLIDIFKASQVPGEPEEFSYILLNEKEGLLNCFLFRANSIHEVTDIFGQMRAASPVTPKGTTASSVTKNVGFQQNCEPPWSNPGITLPGNCNSNLTGESPLVRSVSNASALTSLSADLSPSDSHFFEVLYIGKVRISQRKVPESLIDDALFKFSQHEAEKAKTLRRYSLLSSAGTSIYSNDSTETLNNEKSPENNDSKNNIVPSTTPLEPDKATPWKSTENLPVDKSNEIDQEFDMFTKDRVEKNGQSKKPVPLEPSVVVLNVQKNNLGTVKEDEEKIDDKDNKTKSNPDIVKDVKEKVQSNLKVNDLIDITKETKDAQKVDKVRQDSPAPNKMNFNEIPQKPRGLKGLDERRSSMPENRPFLRDRSASIGTLNLKTPIAHLIGEQNRTMLFQVARSELRLISPDRKQILLHRAFRDVASCVVGRSNREHFGFVCRENNDSYACYVFKCESDSVAEEVVNAIRQAFVAHAELLKKSREKSPNMTCEHCPMLWYHRLCHDIEGMNEKKTHASILRRLEQLPEDEQDLIITKYQGGTNHMYETSEHNSFLMMLLRAHCEAKQQRHVHDTAENRSEFLNQYLGGNTIFMKARRSLSNGFDHLLKRKASKDEIFIPPAIVKKEASPHPSLPARLPSPAPELLTPPPAPAPAPRCKSLSPAALPDHSVSDMLASSKSSLTATLEEEEEEEPGTPVHSPMMEIYLKVSDSRPPPKEAGKESDTTWRQAIYEKAIRPGDEEGEMTSKTLLSIPSAPPGKRSKEQLRQLWKMAIDQTILLVRMEKENAKLRESEESSAVRRIKLEYRELGTCDTGVTLMWDSLLSRDHSQPIAKVDRYMLTQAVMQGVPRMSRGAVWYFLAEQASLRAPAAPACPRYHTPYAALLAGLTKHQHAILIDLGRTFPKHSYFASALGPGQLALYNILKAYSLLDPEVGYCQGLSFVAGVLLLHMEEAEAFVLLRHLMFRRGLRKQYLPDMSALQVQLYQLSRLLRDHEPELFAKLQSLDISPALYAAPWMLTLFTSQFPLGFVVRVFDLIFLDSFDVVFSVSLALLSAHRDGLMLCESCEEAAEYLKHKLADVNKVGCEKILKKIHTLDIKQQLTEYAVEYAVLREEMPRLATLTEENRRLVADANKMTEELDSAMDAITNFQKSQARMESSNKGMEQQLTLLSRYISAYHRQDMPPEIKRIVNNYSKKLSFSSKITSFSSKFTSNEDDDDGKKHLKTGISAPNLFAKISRDDMMNAVNKDRNASPDTEKPDKRMTMKKSLSVHSGLLSSNLKQYPLKVLEEKSENEYKKSDSMRNDRIITESLKELSRRNAGFFANTHEQIRQERFFEQQLKHDFDENLKKLDEKLSSKSYIDDLSIFQSRKSMSLNLNSSTKENKLNDSGFVTPLTPADDKKDDTCSIVSHPLSDCDVEITDLQSTKLKQIRTTRMGSANSIEK